MADGNDNPAPERNRKTIRVSGVPIHLTWKGVPIFFPRVVITEDLREAAELALQRLQAEEAEVEDVLPSDVIVKEEREESNDEEIAEEEVPDPDELPTPTLEVEPGPPAPKRLKKSLSRKKKKTKAKACSQGSNICEICGISFHSAYSLERHSLSHTNADGKCRKFGPCQCGAKFSRQQYLKSHRDECVVANKEKNEMKSTAKTSAESSTIRIKLEPADIQSTSENTVLAPGNADWDSEDGDNEMEHSFVENESPVHSTSGVQSPITEENTSEDKEANSSQNDDASVGSKSSSKEKPSKTAPTQKPFEESVTPIVFKCKCRDCTHFFSHEEDLWCHIDKKHVSVGSICCGQCGQDFETRESLKEHQNDLHFEDVPEEEEFALETSNTDGVSSDDKVPEASLVVTGASSSATDNCELDDDFEYFELGQEDFENIEDSEDLLMPVISSAGSIRESETSLNSFGSQTAPPPKFVEDVPFTTRVVKETKEYKHQCSICDKKFQTLFNLKRHAQQHTQEKNFKCDDCGKRFMNNFFLIQHQKKQCKKVPCKYSCHCGDKFHTVDSLERHIKMVHDVQKISKIFRCYVCNDQFIQSFELDQHVRETHPVIYAEFMQHKAIKQQEEDQRPPQIKIKIESDAAGSEETTERMEEYNNDEDNYDSIPLYPEVVMKCDDTVENTNENMTPMDTIAQDVNNDATAAGSKESAPETEETTGGWNFIPGLAGDAQDSESSSEEFDDAPIPVSFEPEDVDISQSQAPSKLTPSPTKVVQPRQRRVSQDLDWTPGVQLQPVSMSSAGVKKRRVVNRTNEGNFKCGYCDKRATRLAFIKTHFTVHRGLPFKFVDLTLHNQQGPSFSASTAAVSAPRFTQSQSSHPPVARILPVTYGTASVTTTATSESQADNHGAKARPTTFAAPCGCAVEDTALGYHKRCTGESCGCYNKYKGCSEQCLCRKICGNPYFRDRGVRPATSPAVISLNSKPVRIGSAVVGSRLQQALQPPLQVAVERSMYNVNSVTNIGNFNPSTTVTHMNRHNMNPVPQNQMTASMTFFPATYGPHRPQAGPSTMQPETPVFTGGPAPPPVSKIYRCYCNNDFNTLGDFLRHQWEHREEQLFLCPVCRLQFFSVGTLIMHARQHAEVGDITAFPCMACDKILMNEEEVQRHFVSCHSTLICDLCQKQCPTRVDLQVHRQSHALCKFCGMTFANAVALRCHLADKHAPCQVPQSNTNPTSSHSHYSVNACGEPEVVILDDDCGSGGNNRPPSPQAPVIVQVSGSIYTAKANYPSAQGFQQFGYN